MQDNYIASWIPRYLLNDFLQDNHTAGCDVRTVSLYQGNECLIRWAPAPYRCDIKSEVYSISKIFTSTAIGLAVDEGLLSTDEYVVDIFPADCPATCSENLKAMRVHHLLSMNTGHDLDTMPYVRSADNGVRDFLARDVVFAPGSHFLYNTGATYMLSAIISLRTGMSLLDYLSYKLFHKIGIDGASWSYCGGEVCQGGTGITISNDDMAKLGLFYTNDGVWNGERLLSHEWIARATATQSDNSSDARPDWSSGYGYQFWRNARDGFRGDGACGQLIVILPRHNMTLVVQSESDNMQGQMDIGYTLTDAVAACDRSVVATDTDCAIFDAYPTLPAAQTPAPFTDCTYRCDKNPLGFTWVRLHEDDNGLALTFSDGCKTQTIRAGMGNWQESVFYAPYFKPKLISIMQLHNEERIHLAASYTATSGEDAGIEILCHHLNAPHRETIRIHAIDGGIQLDLGCRFELLEPSARIITAYPFSANA